MVKTKPLNSSKRNRYKICLTAMLLLVFTMSFAYASLPNRASHTYDNQISTNAGNPSTDLNLILSGNNLTYNYHILTINNDNDNMIVKVGDIDNSGVKSLITFQKGSNTIYYTKAVGNSPQPSQSFNLPTGFGIQDLILLTNLENTENIMWIVMSSASEVRIIEANIVSGNLNILYTFKTGLTQDYGMYGEFSCNSFTSAGVNRNICIYQALKTDTVVMLDNYYGERYFELGVANLTQKDTYTYNIGGYSTRPSQIHLAGFGTELFYECSISQSRMMKATTDLCSMEGERCNLVYYDNVNVHSNSLSRMSRIEKIVVDNVEYFGVLAGLSSTDPYIYKLFDRNLNVVTTQTITPTPFGVPRPILDVSVIDYNGDGIARPCFRLQSYDSTSDGNNVLYCATTSLTTHETIVSETTSLQPLVTGYANGNDNYIMYMEDGKFRLRNSDETITIQNPEINTFVGKMWFDDISGNGKADLIGVSSTGGFYATSEPIQPSTLTITTPYVYNYYNPTCTNTNITFKMKNAKFSQQYTYISNNPDINERTKICSDCGGTQPYACGSYSLATPQILCYNFSTPATHEIDFYAYTDVNDNIPVTFKDYLTEELSNRITISLGVQDTNCNNIQEYEDALFPGGTPVIPGDDDEDPPFSPGDDIESAQDLLQIFGMGGTLWSIIIGLVIILAITFYAFQQTRSFGISIISFVISLVLTTYLGLIPIWVIILIGFLVIGILVSTFIFGNKT